MSLRRKSLSFLGALTLAAWLCAPAGAQHRPVHNELTADDNSETSTLRTEIGELHAQANGGMQAGNAPVAAEGHGGCGGCCDTCCQCCDDCWGCSSCCPHL